MSGLTLDAGALIAYGRDDRLVGLLLKRIWEKGDTVYVPAGVVGRVWRDGRRQVWLARLLNRREVDVVHLDALGAKASGEICARAGTADVIDASVIVCAAQRGTPVVTGDLEDLRRLGPAIPLIAI